MSSSKTLNNLNIRKFPSKASFKNATNIGEDDLCVVAGSGEPLMQFETMPTASTAWVGQTIQYTGETGADGKAWLIQGHLYKCEQDEYNPSNIFWSVVEVQNHDLFQTRITQSGVGANVGTLYIYAQRFQYTDGFRNTSSPITQIITITDGRRENVFVAKVTTDDTTKTFAQTVLFSSGAFRDCRFYLGQDGSADRHLLTLAKEDGSVFGFGGDIYFEITVDVYGFTDPIPESEKYMFYNWTSDDYSGRFMGLEEIPEINNVSQLKVLPTIDIQNLGQIVQYTGATDTNHTNGYFYKATGTPNPVAASLEATETTGTGTTITVNDADGLRRYLFMHTSGSSYDSIVGLINDPNYTWEYDDPNGVLTWGAYPNTDLSGALQYFDFDPAVSGNVVTWTTSNYVPAHIEVLNGAWEQVDVQPSSGGGLPDQTGNSGKFLTTDGTDASWSDKPPLVNNAYGASGYNKLAVGGGASVTADYGTALGASSSVSSSRGIAIGSNASAYGTRSIAIGGKTNANNAIQLGATSSTTSNPDAGTFKVANANGNFEIMSADGTVPTARLTKVNTTATLAVADWSSSTQTVTVNGITSTSVVFVAPDPSDAADYAAAGILCTSQTTNSLTFTATTTPTNDIDVNIVCL